MDPILQVKKLVKVYPGKISTPAVNNISFDLKKGEILGLLGPNGSGKTTTIQMLLGTLSITSGSVYYFGKDLNQDRSEILQKVTSANAYTSLPWILTVRENLEVFGRLYGLDPQSSLKKYEPLLDRFGILPQLNSPVSFLSAGQTTALMLVKAFFVEPSVVLLDEPTASLDPNIAKEICEFVLERKTKGVSILFTSHKMEEAATMCDRTIFLKKGQIIANDIPKTLAQSVSACSLKLVVSKDMAKAVALAKYNQFFHEVEDTSINISIHENKIPDFLNNLSRNDIAYTSIRIEEPSLEDFFLQISRK